MRALILVATALAWSTQAMAHVPEEVAWYANTEFWTIAVAGTGALLGFFSATYVNDRLQRQRADRERRESAIGLAVALKGEALAAADAYKRTRRQLDPIMKAWAFGPPVGQTEDSRIKITLAPEVTIQIYANNITRIELLGNPELIANITQFYSATSREYVIEEVRGCDVYAACENAARVAEGARARAERIAAELQVCADKIKAR